MEMPIKNHQTKKKNQTTQGCVIPYTQAWDTHGHVFLCTTQLDSCRWSGCPSFFTNALASFVFRSLSPQEVLSQQLSITLDNFFFKSNDVYKSMIHDL